MRTFRVYFINGNQKLYDAENIYSLIDYLHSLIDDNLNAYIIEDIYKIEEVY